MDAVPDLNETPIHLGRGPTATAVEGFGWDPEALGAYEERFASDGDEGRLVVMFEMTASWDSWEQHPAGDEVVLVLSGRHRLIQEVEGEERPTEVGAGGYVINGPGVWHTADVLEPGRALFITPGRGTTHRPR